MDVLHEEPFVCHEKGEIQKQHLFGFLLRKFFQMVSEVREALQLKMQNVKEQMHSLLQI
jgi:hypothetical protein